MISTVEDVVSRAEHHFAVLHEWKRVLSPALSWKEEDISTLDLNIRHICSDYSRACSMALLPYLHTASKMDAKILHGFLNNFANRCKDTHLTKHKYHTGTGE